ncbi:MAG: hypothetical protein ACYTE8_12195 [Planctomycetota bacterium]|jgi:hypothetical protein
MKIWEPKNAVELKALMDRLCGCHDASITKITFAKDRMLDEDGNLVYLNCKDEYPFVSCDVEIELLLNSYPTAKKQQVVVFKFIGTRIFVFTQDESFDYSDIYKVKCDIDDNAMLNFIFYSSKSNEMVKSLELSCAQVTCTEL